MRRQRPAAASLPSLSGLRVLIVDDQADARELMRRYMVRCGAEVETASSAPDALVQVRQAAFHAIVSDIGMPEQNGHQLIRSIRKLGFSASVLPAIALTAYAGETDRQQALAAGFQLHLQKPVELAEIARAIAELVSRGSKPNESLAKLD